MYGHVLKHALRITLETLAEGRGGVGVVGDEGAVTAGVGGGEGADFGYVLADVLVVTHLDAEGDGGGGREGISIAVWQTVARLNLIHCTRLRNAARFSIMGTKTQQTPPLFPLPPSPYFLT